MPPDVPTFKVASVALAYLAELYAVSYSIHREYIRVRRAGNRHCRTISSLVAYAAEVQLSPIRFHVTASLFLRAWMAS